MDHPSHDRGMQYVRRRLRRNIRDLTEPPSFRCESAPDHKKLPYSLYIGCFRPCSFRCQHHHVLSPSSLLDKSRGSCMYVFSFSPPHPAGTCLHVLHRAEGFTRSTVPVRVDFSLTFSSTSLTLSRAFPDETKPPQSTFFTKPPGLEPRPSYFFPLAVFKVGHSHRRGNP